MPTRRCNWRIAPMCSKTAALRSKAATSPATPGCRKPISECEHERRQDRGLFDLHGYHGGHDVPRGRPRGGKARGRALGTTDFGLDDITEWRKGGEHSLRKKPQGYLGDP